MVAWQNIATSSVQSITSFHVESRTFVVRPHSS